MNEHQRNERARLRRIPGLAALSLIVVASTACDGLFEVDNPTNIIDEDLNDPSLIEALSYSSEGALSRGYDDAVLWTADMTDEGYTSGSGTFRILIDQGFTDGYNQIMGDIYDDLTPSRWIADEAARRLEELVDNPGSHWGVANAYFWGGIARMTVADMYKQVYLGTDEENLQAVTPAEAIEDAIPRLEKAVQVATAAGETELAAGAEGALARAYRSLYYEAMHNGGGASLSTFEQAAQHAQAALSTMANYNVKIHYEQPGSSNGVYSEMNQGRYVNMDPDMANIMDPVSGQKDPRIKHGPLIDKSPRTGEDIYREQKYFSYGADIPVSRAAEAQLILAENAYLHDDMNMAVQYINMARNAANLPDFSSTDPAEVWDQLLYERKVEFWLELRRWQDMRYYEITPPDWADVNKAAGVHRRFDVSQVEQDAG